MLLTRQRISRQFVKRRGSQGLTTSPARIEEQTRTGTLDRIPDPAVPDLEAMWDEEWEKHLLTVAAERVKRQVKPEHFQVFDLLALQH